MSDIDVLLLSGCSADVVAHCLQVSKTAVRIAEQVKAFRVDIELVRLGGLFHDIGRSKTHGIEHAIAGVEIGRSLGLSGQLLLIIERHIGAGITAVEAVRLGLPEKDYLPVSCEEKIVSYADNLINGVRQMVFPEALDRFRSILGPDHEGLELFRKQHAEIQEWIR